jgi:hypothetical protein
MRRYAALVALALMAGGCGGGGGGAGGGGSSAAAGDPVSQAAAKTARAGSVQADFTISGSTLNGSGTGAFNNDAKGTGRLSMAVQSQGRSISIETIAVGPLLFIRSPVFRAAGLPASKWVKLDLAEIARQHNVDLGSLVNSNPSPAGALAYLQGSTEVKKLGGEHVQGVETTHYQVTVDLQRAAQQARGRARDAIRKVITVSGLKRIPVQAWVDGEGYIRKVSYTEHSGRQQSADVTMKLHDFGPHVSIASPPESSVVDFQQLLRQGG